MSGFVTMSAMATEYKQPPHIQEFILPDINIECRQYHLESILKIKKIIKQYELEIFRDGKLNSYDKIKRIKKIIKKTGKNIPCEFVDCKNKTYGFNNFCKACFRIEKGPLKDLFILRNLNTRISYLQEIISKSLANVIEKDELIDSIDEIIDYERVFLH